MSVLKIRNSSDDGWIILGGAYTQEIITDEDLDTYITCEESADEDRIRFYTAGKNRMTIWTGDADNTVIKLNVGTTSGYMDMWLGGIESANTTYTVRLIAYGKDHVNDYKWGFYEQHRGAWALFAEGDGSIDVTNSSFIKDEDDMASDSDGHLASQQSIKAYADTYGGQWTYGTQSSLSGNSTYTVQTGLPGDCIDVEILVLAISPNVANSELRVQVGTDTGWHISGYNSVGGYGTTALARQTATTCFSCNQSAVFDAASTITGRMTFRRWFPAQNYWFFEFFANEIGNTGFVWGSGYVQTPSDFDRIKFFFATSTTQFDAGYTQVRYRQYSGA